MKKIYTLFLGLFIFSNTFAQLNSAEKAPYVKNDVVIPSKAAFDLHFSFSPQYPGGGNIIGLAGCMFMGGQYWATKWAGDSIIRFNGSGTYVDALQIPGLSGARALTTDGNMLYASNNTGTIYRIDPSTNTLSPPHITTALSFNVRSCTYSSSLDGGNGGFWVSNFGSDIVAVSMSGATLNTILAATHAVTGMYGMAVDDITPGGPYLWAFAQMAPNNSMIIGLEVADGSTAYAAHDVYPDISSIYSLSSNLAGGIFLTDDIVSGQTHLCGVSQGTPVNVVFVYELNNPFADLKEKTESKFELFPNPANNLVTVRLESQTEYSVVDLSGKVVLSGQLSELNNTIDVSALESGSYLVKLEIEGSIQCKKLVIE
jgi:Secretion system C-terminal sorting domain